MSLIAGGDEGDASWMRAADLIVVRMSLIGADDEGPRESDEGR
jgi:hypothetical protein